MNGSAYLDTDLSSCLIEKHYYVRDANGQIVFSYGDESEQRIDTSALLWEHSIDQIIEFTSLLLCRFYDSENRPNDSVISVSNFLLHIIATTKISASTIVCALILINRLKTLNPTCRGSGTSGHRLLLAALLLASKMTMDETYDNKSWAYASAGLFDVDDVNQMEMEFLALVDYHVFVSSFEWMDFTATIIKNHGGDASQS